MKLLIFSDTHLTDEFDEHKFRYLLDIISAADKVIINGDFWDKYFINFDTFVNSEWNRLFPVLKQKQAVYIYGNHDPKEYADERVNLFSAKQAMHYDIDADGLTLHVEHGQRIVPNPGGFLSFLTPWEGRLLERTLHFVLGRYLNRLLQHLNEKMKVWHQQNLPENTILVCGHTHLQENALMQKFLNSGFNNFGYGQYLWVEEGVAQVHTIKYHHQIFNLQIASQIKR